MKHDKVLPFSPESLDRLDGISDMLARAKGDLRFAGKPREVARQFLLATIAVAELLGGLGAKAIDYEALRMPSGGSPGDYADACTTLVSWKLQIEAILAEVLGGESQRNREIWTLARGQFTRATDKLTGASWLTTASTDFIASQFNLSTKTVAEVATRIDERLYDALSARGWYVKGDLV